LKDHDPAGARAGYRQAVEVDESYGPAWFNLGVLAEADRDWREAGSDFNRYLAVAPQGRYTERAHRELAVVRQRLEHPSLPATQRYDDAIHRAKALLAARLYRESLAEAGLAESIDKSRWEAYAIAAVVMAKQHDASAAARFRQQALLRIASDQREHIDQQLTRVISESSP